MASLCLTEADCMEIAANLKNGCKLAKFHLQPFCEDVRGYLGSHYLLKLDIIHENKNQDVSFFVKTLDAGNLSACFEDSKIFEKEVFLYQFLIDAKRALPKIDDTILPKMIYCSNKTQTLVLENLCEQGYKGLDSITFDKPHMMKALETTAKFHSVSIAYEAHKSKTLGKKYELDEDFDEIMRPLFSKNKNMNGHKFIRSCEIGIFALIDLLYHVESENSEMKLVVAKAVNELFTLINDKTGFTNILCHGDLWGNNCLFKYDNENNPIGCKLVDFQLNRYTPPAHDVTMLIYMASDRNTFKTNVHDYYNHYYTCLSNELQRLNLDIKKVLPLDEFEATCRLYMPTAKLIWLCYRETSQTTDENFQKVATNLEALRSAVLGEGRRSFVTENFNIDDNYRVKLSNIFEDFRLSRKHDLITIEDCYKILHKKLKNMNYNFVDYNVAKMEQRIGYLGDHYILTMKIKRDQVEILKFFVKVAPSLPSHKDFIDESGASYKEMQFFRKLLPDMQMYGINIYEDFAPKCYQSKPDLLILECLTSIGYKIYDVRKCMKMDTLKSGLRSVAKLHASGILLEEKLKAEFGEHVTLKNYYPREIEESFYTKKPISVNWLTAAKKGFKEQIKMYSNYTSNITPEEFYKLGTKYIDKFVQLTKPSTKYRNTICHADLWASNMMFTFVDQDEHCVLVDFQSYRYCPPAHDVMQFLYLSTNIEFRSRHKAEVLRYYYEEFKKNIEANSVCADDILTYEQYLASCEEETAFAITQTVTHFQNIMMSPERAAEVFGDPDFCGKAYFVDRSEQIRISAEKDPLYNERVEESIEDLRKLCEKTFSDTRK